MFEIFSSLSVTFLPRVPEDQESVVVAEEAVEEGEKKEKKIEVDGADVEDVEDGEDVDDVDDVEDGEDVEEVRRSGNRLRYVDGCADFSNKFDKTMRRFLQQNAVKC